MERTASWEVLQTSVEPLKDSWTFITFLLLHFLHSMQTILQVCISLQKEIHTNTKQIKKKYMQMLTVFKQTFNRFTGGTDEVEFLLLKSARYKLNFESPLISDFGNTPVLPEKVY